jgi:hypothetical protein
MVTILTELTWLRRKSGIYHKYSASRIATVQLLANIRITRNVTQPLVSRLSCELSLVENQPRHIRSAIVWLVAITCWTFPSKLITWSHTHLLESSSFLWMRITEEKHKKWTGSFTYIALDFVFGKCSVWIPARTPAVLNKGLAVFLSSSRQISG